MKQSEHLGGKVIILSNQVKHYLHQAAEAEGISGSQSRILHFLVRESAGRDIYQKDIEDKFFLRRSTVTQTLQSMERNGLITRCSVASDARLKKLVLTDYGRELSARIEARVEKMESHLAHNLSQEEITAFHHLMEKMSRNMTEIGAPQDIWRKPDGTRSDIQNETMNEKLSETPNETMNGKPSEIPNETMNGEPSETPNETMNGEPKEILKETSNEIQKKGETSC
ncbi:MAG: MarR family winged helix-turn-helix transcriptional regulator [Bacteroides sp.]|nr:MarR family winged helix-turn-helix transcriptional regulator [Bacteroides sp.]MCM1550322.1 MarR family winged helix-turn-helix transcriptional regulator [Clostridium sp.]